MFNNFYNVHTAPNYPQKVDIHTPNTSSSLNELDSLKDKIMRNLVLTAYTPDLILGNLYEYHKDFYMSLVYKFTFNGKDHVVEITDHDLVGLHMSGKIMSDIIERCITIVAEKIAIELVLGTVQGTNKKEALNDL